MKQDTQIGLTGVKLLNSCLIVVSVNIVFGLVNLISIFISRYFIPSELGGHEILAPLILHSYTLLVFLSGVVLAAFLEKNFNNSSILRRIIIAGVSFIIFPFNLALMLLVSYLMVQGGTLP
jgi:hypothetical protein